MYTLDYSLALGNGKIGLTLAAQLVDSDGVDVGTEIIDTFTEIGNGNYLWHYESFPDDFRGGIKFYEDGVLATILSFVSVNPEEAEYVGIIKNTILNPEEVEINVGHSEDRIDIIPGVR
jgi:hypothetical protein